MNQLMKKTNLVGWAVFAITALVYFFSVERTGSLWDCGEFVSGAYKLQVVHPPGAPLFLIIGRLFTVVADWFSSDPSTRAFAVNLLSGLCSAFAAMFICWTAMMLGKLALVGRDREADDSEFMALAATGVVAGLCTAFATSVWFSAVEGEVYSMSTFFTAFTLWAMMKWYYLPDKPDSDRWMILAVYAAGLSIGVHLLSLLTFPALALFYYYKKTEKPTFLGMLASGVVGVLLISAVQSLVITGIPKLWSEMDYFLVNTFGLPFNSGIIPVVGIVSAAVYFGLKYAHKAKNATIQYIVFGFALLVISFSTYGMVIIRANANPPINMNNPADPIKLLPYLNREQYGERPLVYGPQFNKKYSSTTSEDRYGRVGNHYEKVDEKRDPVYNDEDKVFFPRMGHSEGDREAYYKRWMGLNERQPLPNDRPDAGDNFSYFWNYQMNWMYWRYFMWNFSGRQNGEQGFTPNDIDRGNWVSGIPFLDNRRLYDRSKAPTSVKTDLGYNRYFMLPFLFGLFGLVWHFGKRRYDMLGLVALFIITGIGIIIYTNEPPNEPRERDYALVGSFLTYSIWIGMGVLAFFDILRDLKLAPKMSAGIAGALVMIAPILMGTQNFDDHSRANHKGARDYASNFLESCDKNAILFTYGDNDTYPLWYAQEVEGIRKDVRVVNLSLIAVDWYIDQLRRKVNESPAVKLTIPASAMIGSKRNQLPIQEGNGTAMNLLDVLAYMGGDHKQSMGNGYEFESSVPSRKVFIPIDRQKAIANGVISAQDSVGATLEWSLSGQGVTKDDIAVLDIIANNINERPIYFAVTARPEKMQGLNAYSQLEGLALRIIPVKTTTQEKGFGLIGYGRVATDKIFDRITNKWRWGNFNHEKTFIDRSYKPSTQTMQFVILRTATELVAKGDKAKAITLIDKMFEGFPNNNFPYDGQTNYFLEVLLNAGGYDHAKKHIDILSQNLAENFTFYQSLNAEQMKSFENDRYRDMYTLEELTKLIEKVDPAKKAELDKKFEPFGVKKEFDKLMEEQNRARDQQRKAEFERMQMEQAKKNQQGGAGQPQPKGF
jgi:Protein of unknown function (DUF2723)